MTLPAISTPGSLGENINVAAAASHEFSDSAPPPNARKVVWYLRCTRVNTWVVERSYDGGGTFDVIRTLQTTDLTNPQHVVMVDAPIGFGAGGAPVTFRHTVTNDDGAASAAVQISQAWER